MTHPLAPGARRLLSLLERAVVSIERAVEPPPVALVLEATPDVMLVQHLGLQHLGRWVYLPGRPQKLGPKYAAEPSVVAIAGRLVGIRAGEPGKQDQPGHRVLVLEQGGASAPLSVSVADRVDVAPREW